MAGVGLRVLLVSQEMPPETGWGGIGTYVGTLAPALAAAGATVEVLSVVTGQRARVDTQPSGVVVHRAALRRPPAVGRLLRSPETWNRLTLATAVAWHRRRLGAFDVVECPDWMAEGLALTWGRTPVVVRLHSSLADVDARWMPRSSAFDLRWAARLEAVGIRRADLVTGTRAAIAAHAGSLDTVGVPHRSIPCPVAAGEPPTPVRFDPPSIGFIGRFERRKGPETLVRAMPRVLELVPDARLSLVGRDMPDDAGRSTAAGLRHLAAGLGVGHAVAITDEWQTPEGVRRCLEAATVCAVPSVWESFGYTAAEASAAGRPVIASRLPPLADVVEDGITGCLVEPDDPDEWGRVLGEVLRDRDRAQAMGAAGADRVRDRFAPARVASATIDAYREAIARSGHRSR